MNRAAIACVLLGVGNLALAQGSAPSTVRPYLWSADRAPSQVGEINVFRRFSSDRTAEMREFYGEVLGLTVLPETAAGGGQMIRYPVGGSEVKLFPVAPSAANTADVADAAGVRVLTFFYRDQAALMERFTARGLQAPRFDAKTSHAGAIAAALVQDPEGEWVELVVVPGASAAELARFEIGITADDLAASRAFYGDFMGLAPQPPVQRRAARRGQARVHSRRHDHQRLVVRLRLAARTRRRRACSTSSGTSPPSMKSCVSAARGRPAALGAGANANAVARGSRRREQLLRAVRRQRQQAAGRQ